MFEIEGDVVIERPIEEVFDFAVDERNEPRYNPRMRVAELTTEGPIGVGTRFHSEVVSAGRPVSMDGEITEYERPYRYGLAVRLAAMDIRGHVAFEPAPGGTRMSWSWEVEPRGLYKLVAPIMAPIGRRQERAIWTGLKRYLETENRLALANGTAFGVLRH